MFQIAYSHELQVSRKNEIYIKKKLLVNILWTH